MKSGAIVLAAGLSRRMAQGTKLCAMLGEMPLVRHSIMALAKAGLPPPIVVLGAHADDVRAALDGCDVVFQTAPNYQQGLSQSLKAGLSAVPDDWDAVMICLGDMPLIAPSTYEKIAHHPALQNQVIVPHHQGQRGNPLRWGRCYFEALAQLQGDVGGKALVHAENNLRLDIEDEGILHDVDTDAALAQARALYASRPSS